MEDQTAADAEPLRHLAVPLYVPSSRCPQCILPSLNPVKRETTTPGTLSVNGQKVARYPVHQGSTGHGLRGLSLFTWDSEADAVLLQGFIGLCSGWLSSKPLQISD